MNKKGMIALGVAAVVLLAVMVGAFISMNGDESQNGKTPGGTGETGNNTAGGNDSETVTLIEPVTDIERVESYQWDDSAETTTIKLGNSKTAADIKIDGSNVKISGNDIIIGAAGQYDISGTLEEGRIVVDAKDKEVFLRLNGAHITCSYSSAIYGYEASKLTIVLADGTENSITDTKEYDYSDDFSLEVELEPNACLYSKMDLLICGEGKLTVNGNCEQGITGKDSLYIADATLEVESVGKAILGKDKLVSDTAIVKANATDDALHSNGNILIAGGSYTLASGDDGIHADAAVISDGGKIYVTNSVEGIEGWQVSLINSDIEIEASDDGINATSVAADEMDFGGMGGNGNFGGGQMPGGNGDFGGDQMPPSDEDRFNPNGAGGGMVQPREIDQSQLSAVAEEGVASDTETFVKIINSGIVINAGGDGLDSNGSVFMDGGTVVVYGPSNSGNGGLDYATSFELVSGTLLVMDMSGMAMAPNISSIPGIDVTLPTNLANGDVVCVSSDNYSYSFEVKKNCNHFTLIAPDMAEGDAVSVLTGGDLDKEVDDPVVSGGSYSGGSEVASLTLESGVTYYGGMGGMNGMGGQGGFGGEMNGGFGRR